MDFTQTNARVTIVNAQAVSYIQLLWSKTYNKVNYG